MSKTGTILIRHPAKPAKLLIAGIAALLVTSAGAQVVIDMPAPPRKEVAMVASPLPTIQSDAHPVEPDAGDLALRRYAYGRTGTYDTYQFGSQFVYQSSSWWWGGFWPWWGSCSVRCVDRPASSVKCSVTGKPG